MADHRSGLVDVRRLIVENDTGRAMHVWGCGALFVVALTSSTYQPAIAWPLCLQSFTIPVLVRIGAFILGGCCDCGSLFETPGRR